MQLDLDHVSVPLNGQPICEDLSLSLDDGRFGCLLGPSGSGKTTLLRAIAGFLPVADGAIRIGERTLSTVGTTCPPAERGIGMVFQDLALLPHLSVEGNVAFGLHRLAREARRERVREMLALTGLEGLEGRYPHELSGGQNQRVAVARALAPRPRLLLLDEPFSSLDTDLRLNLAQQLRRIVERTGTTTLMVTHDQHEAFALGDRVGVLNLGRLQQWDSPYALYHRPANRFVASFIGDGVLLPGRVDDQGLVATELGRFAQRNDDWPPGQAVDLLLRPDDIQHDDDSPLTATIARKAFRGAEILYRLELPSGQPLLALVPSHHNHPLGQPLGIRLEVDHLILFPAD